MKLLLTPVGLFLTVIPVLAMADGLVPCGGVGQPSCEACYLYTLTENIFAWIFGVLLGIGAIMIAVGGLQLVFSGGSLAAKQSARKTIKTALISLILVGTSWTLIDLTIATLYGQADAGSIWTSLQCVSGEAT